jgi:ATP-dependent DNA helicase RecQ
MATLLWNEADVATREFLIERGRDPQPGRRTVPIDPADVERRKALDHQKLQRMVAYARAPGCLRATILRYFGDTSVRRSCGSCSNCDRRTPLDAADCILVRKILSGIARAGERFGRRRIIAMLTGELDDLPDALTTLSTTGLLKDENPETIDMWIDAACASGMVKTSTDKYRTLSLTPHGREMMTGRLDDVRMMISMSGLDRVWSGERRRRMASVSPPARKRRWR